MAPEEVLSEVSPSLTYFGTLIMFLMKVLLTYDVPLANDEIVANVNKFSKENNYASLDLSSSMDTFQTVLATT